MLSKLDDYPVHQTAEPIAQTASSDRCHYDRYWYNGHTQNGDLYFGIAMCRYPNLGILDGSLSVVIDGQQYAFHGSRRAPDEPTETVIGPFALEILEPMGRHRITVNRNDTGIECDLVFTPKTASIEEARQTLRNDRYVVMDATRLDQFGRWDGFISLHGKKIEIDGGQTLGLKDRSWGIRPVGEPYTGGAPLDNFQATHFMWLPIHWENECTLAGWFENGEGQQWHTDQGILPCYSEPAGIPGATDPAIKLWQGKVAYDIKLQAGTRRFTEGEFTLQDSGGEQMEITVKATDCLHRMKGLGYQHPEWGHGRWQGELKIAAEQWAVADGDPLALENIHIQQVISATRRLPSGEVETGHGILEQLHIGPHAKLGLTDWFDGAK